MVKLLWLKLLAKVPGFRRRKSSYGHALSRSPGPSKSKEAYVPTIGAAAPRCGASIDSASPVVLWASVAVVGVGRGRLELFLPLAGDQGTKHLLTEPTPFPRRTHTTCGIETAEAS